MFNNQQSSLLDITASIIQGSAIRPAAYVVNAGDLTATVPGNSLCKFADDTYSIIPASNEASRQSELANIQNWAQQNNLKLNCSKSCEIIFSYHRHRRRHAVEPLPLPGITRSRSMKMLGVEIANNFTVTQHVQQLATSSAQTIYALRVLRTRGLSTAARLPFYRRRSIDVRSQLMAWSHQGIGSPAHQLGQRPSPSPWLLLAGPADLRRPLRHCRR